jgi:hypothetical protein
MEAAGAGAGAGAAAAAAAAAGPEKWEEPEAACLLEEEKEGR